jgi:hypothetical protein
MRPLRKFAGGARRQPGASGDVEDPLPGLKIEQLRGPFQPASRVVVAYVDC